MMLFGSSVEPCAQDYCDRGDSPGRCVWCSVVYVVMRMHCRNHNRHSIGICYEGGLDAGKQCLCFEVGGMR